MEQIQRTLCAEQFLRRLLTEREQMLVTAFALGYSQADIAQAWAVSPPAICQMARRIQVKADRYWQG